MLLQTEAERGWSSETARQGEEAERGRERRHREGGADGGREQTEVERGGREQTEVERWRRRRR